MLGRWFSGLKRVAPVPMVPPPRPERRTEVEFEELAMPPIEPGRALEVVVGGCGRGKTAMTQRWILEEAREQPERHQVLLSFYSEHQFLASLIGAEHLPLPRAGIRINPFEASIFDAKDRLRTWLLDLQVECLRGLTHDRWLFRQDKARSWSWDSTVAEVFREAIFSAHRSRGDRVVTLERVLEGLGSQEVIDRCGSLTPAIATRAREAVRMAGDDVEVISGPTALPENPRLSLKLYSWMNGVQAAIVLTVVGWAALRSEEGVASTTLLSRGCEFLHDLPPALAGALRAVGQAGNSRIIAEGQGFHTRDSRILDSVHRVYDMGYGHWENETPYEGVLEYFHHGSRHGSRQWRSEHAESAGLWRFGRRDGFPVDEIRRTGCRWVVLPRNGACAWLPLAKDQSVHWRKALERSGGDPLAALSLLISLAPEGPRFGVDPWESTASDART